MNDKIRMIRVEIEYEDGVAIKSIWMPSGPGTSRMNQTVAAGGRGSIRFKKMSDNAVEWFDNLTSD